MKFIKIQDTIVNVEGIKSIYTHDQYLVIECANKNYRFIFDSQMGATEELNRIYKQLE